MRADITDAWRKALQTKLPAAIVIPSMSAGATDAVFTRAANIPTYGVGALWGYIGEPLGSHGLDERILAKAFHDQVDIWEVMLKDLAGR